MKWPVSLEARLGLSVGLVLTVLWLLAATVTAVIVRGELDEVFDSALREVPSTGATMRLFAASKAPWSL